MKIHYVKIKIRVSKSSVTRSFIFQSGVCSKLLSPLEPTRSGARHESLAKRVRSDGKLRFSMLVFFTWFYVSIFALRLNFQYI